eukprot:SAG25_NODE_305_length_10124_cov_16.774464_8_plen_94_part_00
MGVGGWPLPLWHAAAVNLRVSTRVMAGRAPAGSRSRPATLAIVASMVSAMNHSMALGQPPHSVLAVGASTMRAAGCLVSRQVAASCGAGYLLR